MSGHRLVWEVGGLLLTMAGAVFTRTFEVSTTLALVYVCSCKVS
ncbi:hypothetical protein B0G38_002649 [Arthrobacter sp. VKM Ac-2550]|nr:hypothetical protein [Arthrobacter sp. VKM Ac-2550]